MKTKSVTSSNIGHDGPEKAMAAVEWWLKAAEHWQPERLADRDADKDLRAATQPHELHWARSAVRPGDRPTCCLSVCLAQRKISLVVLNRQDILGVADIINIVSPSQAPSVSLPALTDTAAAKEDMAISSRGRDLCV